jgi:hypothetical protein
MLIISFIQITVVVEPRGVRSTVGPNALERGISPRPWQPSLRSRGWEIRRQPDRP